MSLTQTYKNQLSSLEQQRRHLQSALQQREANVESREIHGQLEEQLHKLSSQLPELRMAQAQHTSVMEQLKSGVGEKSIKLDALRQDGRQLRRSVEQLRRMVAEGKRLKEIQEREQKKVCTFCLSWQPCLELTARLH